MCTCTAPALPFDYILTVDTGQSLGCGVGATSPLIDTSQRYANAKLLDASGVYGPSSVGPFSLVPLVAPLRPLNSSTYPNNIQGEDFGIVAANQLSQFTLGSQANGALMIETNVATAAAALSQINKGTLPYNSSLWEATTIKGLVPIGKTFGVLAVLLKHGEADASSPSYQAGIAQLQSDYQTDLQAITGQTRAIPLIATQQCSEPVLATTVYSSLAYLALQQSSGGAVLLAGPDYQYPHTGDNIHMPTASYRAIACKYAEVMWRLVLGQAWAPLAPLSYAVNGRVVTIPMNVPQGSLVIDAVFAPPHQTANLQWQNAHGFEAADSNGVLTIDSVAISSNAIVLTLHTTPASGLVVGYAITPDVTTSAQGGLPTGRRGQLRDTNPVCGYDGSNLYNWCCMFQSPALT